ncbi:hypothetical protein [Constantimarinum furrinae]|uniref:Uncharacterized protein n=1 Tax=Constantimarinum furrinae TaxID=2562285 RepID=A0A7G8PRJ1_9FLAO|nr:hypothetical protein [Constantimarinum furrinae]QNJ96957.1 hypothetical protein ALE3EI_0370 [Constantimarinum furrinae]
MKKALFILAVVTVGFAVYSFTEKDENPIITSEKTTTISDDIIKTIENEDLNDHIQKNFVRYFDDVEFVTAHYSDTKNFYYYKVHGSKNGISTTQGLKIEKSDLENETYTYIDFSNIQVNELTEYCKDDSSNPECFCVRPNFKFCQIICAVWNGTTCYPPL